MTLFLRTILLSVTFFMLGCNSPSEAQQAETNKKKDTKDIVLETSLKNIGPLTIGMTSAEIEELKLPFTKHVKNIEGDEYKVYLVTLPEGPVVENLLNLEEQIYSITTSSILITDTFGNGAGSNLESLKTSYPNGRLIYGFADGRFLRFLTDSPLVFSMDKSVIAESCFETGASCEMPVDLKVVALEIGPYSPK